MLPKQLTRPFAALSFTSVLAGCGSSSLSHYHGWERDISALINTRPLARTSAPHVITYSFNTRYLLTPEARLRLGMLGLNGKLDPIEPEMTNAFHDAANAAMDAANITLKTYDPAERGADPHGPQIVICHSDSLSYDHYTAGGAPGGVTLAPKDKDQPAIMVFAWIPDLMDGNLIFLHELGHALGLKHPFDHPDRVASSVYDKLPANLDNTNETVMSYDKPSSKSVGGITGLGANGQRQAYTPLDIAALQWLYGPSRRVHPKAGVLDGNPSPQTNWTITTYVSSTRTLWNGGAPFTLNASSFIKPSTHMLDLFSPATESLLDLNPGVAHPSRVGDETTYLAYGANASTAIGSRVNDNTLIGNQHGGSTLIGGDHTNLFEIWGKHNHLIEHGTRDLALLHPGVSVRIDAHEAHPGAIGVRTDLPATAKSCRADESLRVHVAIKGAAPVEIQLDGNAKPTPALRLTRAHIDMRAMDAPDPHLFAQSTLISGVWTDGEWPAVDKSDTRGMVRLSNIEKGKPIHVTFTGECVSTASGDGFTSREASRRTASHGKQAEI